MTEGEEWLPVIGYENTYEVSDSGRIRSLERWVRCGQGYRKVPAKMMVLGRTKKGYVIVNISRDGKSKTHNVHALVLTSFVGPRPAGMEACHGDGNPKNNRLDNLRWGTPSSNVQDMLRHGNHHQQRKQACPYGHLLQEPNLVKSLLPARSCKACHRARAAAVKLRAKGSSFDYQELSDEKYQMIMYTRCDKELE